MLCDFNVLEKRAIELIEADRSRDAIRIYTFMADGDGSLDGGSLGRKLAQCYERLGELPEATVPIVLKLSSPKKGRGLCWTMRSAPSIPIETMLPLFRDLERPCISALSSSLPFSSGPTRTKKAWPRWKIG